MLSLVIDIQSDVIEGSLIKFPPKGTSGVPHILYSASLHVPRKPHTDGDYLTKMMLKTIGEFTSGLSKELHHLTPLPIQSVEYILSSPWVVSKSKIIKAEYPNETDISESLVKSLIEKERTELIATHEADMVFVEQKIFDIKLNGYSVDKYHGKKAKTLEISLAFTLSSDKIVKKIQTAVSDHLHIKKESFHSAILLQYLTSRNIVSDNEEYIVIHVHGEHTDVIVVKKGQSTLMTAFPTGTSTVVRKVCHSFHSAFETTSSMLKMYVELKLDEAEQKKVEKVLMPILAGWQSELVEAVKDVGERNSIPRRIHLYSGESLSPLLKSTLESNDFEVVIHFEPLREVHSFALKDVI